jgi:hypothetical protein
VHRSGPWIGFLPKSEHQFQMTSTSAITIYFAVINNDEEGYTTFSLSNGAPRTRGMLTYSGKLQMQSWNASSSSWAVLEQLPSWPYDIGGASKQIIGVQSLQDISFYIVFMYYLIYIALNIATQLFLLKIMGVHLYTHVPM